MYPLVCVRGGPNQPLHRDPQWSIVLMYPLNPGSRTIPVPKLPAYNSNGSQRLNCSSLVPRLAAISHQRVDLSSHWLARGTEENHWARTRSPREPIQDKNTSFDGPEEGDGITGLEKKREGKSVRVCWAGNRRVGIATGYGLDD
jgi:hypothetical protein